jgi:hypothetical protein
MGYSWFDSAIVFSAIYWYAPYTYEIIYSVSSAGGSVGRTDHGQAWMSIQKNPKLFARFETVPGFNPDRWDSVPRGRIAYESFSPELDIYNSPEDYLNKILLMNIIHEFDLPNDREYLKNYYALGSTHYNINNEESSPGGAARGIVTEKVSLASIFPPSYSFTNEFPNCTEDDIQDMFDTLDSPDTDE